MMKRGIYLITGLMASGKSTVAELLAARQPRGVHLRGDVFRRMIVTGREEMTEQAGAEALRQLYLRYDPAACAARAYLEAGFTVMLQDNYYGPALGYMLDRLSGCPVEVIVLCPDAETVRRREAGRSKTGYTGFSVESLYASFMRETPRVGLWLDNSAQTPEETADAICARFADD